MHPKKKIAIIGTVGLPAKYGGFETLASHLVEHLDQQYDLTVYCSGKQYPEADRPDKYRGANLKYLPLQANGVQSIPYDTWSILHALLFADVLLILGVAGAWILPFVRLFAVKYAHCDISDNESIQDYTAIRYGSLSSVIEYGADHTQEVEVQSEDVSRYPFLAKPYAFKVCRIEPENNVEMILRAFLGFDKFPLVLVGNWDKSDYGVNLRTTYAANKNLILLDPIYDQREIDLLRGNASLYVHGHSAGGTNPSLVEAMYLGLPIMAFNVSYNRTTTERKAIYFSHAQELNNLLERTPQTALRQLGKEMKEIADRRYKWPLIAQKYQALVEKACATDHKEAVAPSFQQYNREVLTEYGVGHLATHHLFFEKK